MLTPDLKKTIQGAYSQFLQSRELKARYGQKLMIAEIAKTLGNISLDDEGKRDSEGHICVVEAGTGTGKTVAYLLAALPIAQALGKKLVVSTATVALQEQIVNKDIPEILRHSGLHFKVALAKGRGRYLCLSKLDRILSDVEMAANPTQPLYEDEMPQVGEQSVKIYQTMMEAMAANKWDGDKDTWEDGVQDEDWQRITTDHRQCTGRRCANVSACSFMRARDNLGSQDCIVTNHDLVLADLALGGGAILPAPEDSIYIFDEGHHLPDKALNHFAHHSRLISTSKWLDQSQKPLANLLAQVSGAGNVDRFGEQLPAAMLDAKQEMDKVIPMFQALADGIDPSDHTPRYRFDGGVIPQSMQMPCVDIQRAFDRLSDLLGKMANEINEAMEDPHCPVPKVDLENAFPVVGVWQSRAEANRELWASYAVPDPEGAPPKARWFTLVEQGGNLDFEVCSSPILASRTLEYGLWNQCCGAVVTSATLTALGRFDRLMMRAGTPADSQYHVVPSPFDFASAGTLSVPPMATDASNASDHTLSVVDALPQLLDMNCGSLVLFSSRRQMLDVYDALPNDWQDLILVQGDRSKQALIDEHKRRIDGGEGSVIFGLASFAEGVDLPGDYCSHVVIAKIPFAVPDDPVEASLSEWIEARGGNPFMEITVPDAAIKLVQACGRLLRTESDTGTVSLLDRRIVTRRYGTAILNSLPPFSRQIA
ncbi:ATP-dependent DNA helicase DinG [Pseudomaricurvus alkylphenolicus]|jgi:ATP-dependent DNA helicase DinG|uniref:ATP-dependent DNA helicase DinG n=1 Tax=Pseudomaricurvus alkylphenolicus TaxID=1306991 RepID=UPI001420CFBE|nr:ATP-dependent DNA helicase DinG [Pseudomaricurvus alkylphenolicus]NIB40269.1 ATP-dependent DNA helicase DinG [Pseudomaricurvus alkylphenolicus]